MTAEWRDPPLYGTSLTAVKPREGINVTEDEDAQQFPVVYLQWDTQALAECQGLSTSFPFHSSTSHAQLPARVTLENPRAA